MYRIATVKGKRTRNGFETVSRGTGEIVATGRDPITPVLDMLILKMQNDGILPSRERG